MQSSPVSIAPFRWFLNYGTILLMNETHETATERGSIEVLCGCMFSGKTTTLFERLNERKGQITQAFKHSIDDRYSTVDIVSHDQVHFPATTVCSAVDVPERLIPGVQYVAIDEGHFYGERLPDVCDDLASRGIDVIVTTLDPNSWGKPFPAIERLKEMADTVTVKKAVCAVCGEPADRNQRLIPVLENQIVGGAEAFEPRCQSCWTPPPEPSVD